MHAKHLGRGWCTVQWPQRMRPFCVISAGHMRHLPARLLVGVWSVAEHMPLSPAHGGVSIFGMLTMKVWLQDMCALMRMLRRVALPLHVRQSEPSLAA